MAPQSSMVTPKTFADLQGDFCKDEIIVRLIHFWEARNFKKGNILMGLELLLIDTKAFISANRLLRFRDALKPSAIYKVNKFIIRPCKTVYKVCPHKYGITFTDQTTFVEQEICPHQIDVQKFRLTNFQGFVDIVDKHTELLDVIGSIRLINGDNLDTPTPMATAPAASHERSKDMVFLHVQLEDGETARVYLWGTIAVNFRGRWNETEKKPSVILLTTLNAKTLGVAVALSTTSSTRLFLDSDIAETREYLTRFGAGGDNQAAANGSSAVTKLETVTLKEIQDFLLNETPQAAGGKWKKTQTSLACTNPECKKPNKVGIIRYRFEATVLDDDGSTETFVIFDKEAAKFAGRPAPDVMNEMKEDGQNGPLEDAVIPTTTPKCLLNAVGRKCKFQVKVTEFNFGASRQTITVSRIIEDSVSEDIVPLNDVQDAGSKLAGKEETVLTCSESTETAKNTGKRPRTD